MGEDKPAPLLAVRLLFRCKGQFVDLPHVMEAVSLFLDSAVELPLHVACKRGSMQLLDRLWASSEVFVKNIAESDEECDEREEIEQENEQENESFTLRKFLRTDRHYTQYQFTNSLVVAIDSKNLEMVKWLVAKFQGYNVRSEVVSEACIVGSVKMLRVFYENDISSLAVNARVEGVGVRVEWGPKNLKEAVACGHSDVAWWLVEHLPHVLHNLNKALNCAVRNGDVLVAEWLLSQGARWPHDPRGHSAGHQLAQNGRLDVLKWLDGKGQIGKALGYLANAAEGGQLDVVRWLIERDTRNSRDSSKGRMTALGGQASLAIHAAAVNGHLNVAKYLRAQAKGPSSVQYALQAQKQRRLVEHLRHQLGRYNRSVMVSGKTMAMAAGKGYIEMVQWLYEEFGRDPEVDLFDYDKTQPRHIFDDIVAMDSAAKNGHLEVVKYLHDVQKSMQASAKKRKRDHTKQKCTPTCTIKAMDDAAANGHLKVVQWLHSNRSEGCTKSAMNEAAANGHLDVVHWLHENRREGCSTSAMDGAARNGQLGVVKWLHKNSTAGCTARAMDDAATSGHLEIVKWLHEHRAESSIDAAMAGAANFGRLDIVKWFHRKIPHSCSGEMDKAAEGGKLRLLQWLYTNCSKHKVTFGIDEAVRYNYFEAVLFLYHQCQAECTEEAARATIDNDETEDLRAWLLERHPEFEAVEEEEEAFD